MNGFKKWLNSTKFQVAVLGIIFLYLAPVFFEADPNLMAKYIRDIAIAYMGFRIGEPVVEAAVNGVGAWLKGRKWSANTEGGE